MDLVVVVVAPAVEALGFVFSSWPPNGWVGTASLFVLRAVAVIFTSSTDARRYSVFWDPPNA